LEVWESCANSGCSAGGSRGREAPAFFPEREVAATALPPFRLRFYMQREGHVLWLRRNGLDMLIAGSTGPMEIPIPVPIAGVAATAGYIATLIAPSTSSDYILRVYRQDPKDEPTPINVDTWRVQDIRARPDLPELLSKASTNLGPALEQFLTDYVALIPSPPGLGHWLRPEECPAMVFAKLQHEP
jgi:hypothetical protein